MSLEQTHLFSKAACGEPQGQQSRVIHSQQIIWPANQYQALCFVTQKQTHKKPLWKELNDRERYGSDR